MGNEVLTEQSHQTDSPASAENVSSTGTASFPAPSSPFDSSGDGGGLLEREGDEFENDVALSPEMREIIGEDFFQDHAAELESFRNNENLAQTILDSTFIDESAKSFLNLYLEESYFMVADIDDILYELDMGDRSNESEQDLLFEELEWALYDLSLLNDICSTLIEIYNLMFAKEHIPMFLILAEFASKMNEIELKANTDKLHAKFNAAYKRLQDQAFELAKACTETTVDAGLAIVGFIAAAAGMATPGLNIVLLLAGLGVGYALKRDDSPGKFGLKQINLAAKVGKTGYNAKESTSAFVKSLKEGEGIKDATKVFAKEAAKVNGKVKGLGIVQSVKSLGGFLAALDFLLNTVDVGSEFYELILMTKNDIESLYTYIFDEYFPKNGAILEQGEKIDLIIKNLMSYYENTGSQIESLSVELEGLIGEFNGR